MEETSLRQTWADVEEAKVWRADLCADLAMPLPDIDVRRDLVSRGRLREQNDDIDLHRCPAKTKTYGAHLTGYVVGKDELMVRIYDKRREIAVSAKQWFEQLWERGGLAAGVPVTRVEFQMRRNALREIQTSSMWELRQQSADLWKRMVEWLTVRVPNGDSNRWRWPVAEWWQTVQMAGGVFGDICGVSRLSLGRPKFHRLMAQVRGLLISAVGLGMGAAENEGFATMQAREKVREIFEDEIFLEACRERGARMAMVE
ncbi:MAG: hypothetical protein HYX87_08945 [Chloroflexi bacterium]|nr:hypothetical protein [Chloroflexota bacterium]